MGASEAITVYCRICKKPMVTKARNKKYCDECKRKVHNGKNMKYAEENFKVPKKRLPRLATKTINQVMRELDDYNRKNNCSLTYGQYVAMREEEE